nr:dihydroorotate dehydrogenase electron transfer subunit [Sedimentibacter sp.]
MKVQRSIILENKLISNKIYRLIIESDEVIKPGQFFMLKTLDNSFLLPRPISVSDVNNNTITFLYRVEGVGTTAISGLRENDELQLFGPLGNGFDITNLQGKVAVVGGGIGIAPLLYLTKKIGKNAEVYLGYKDNVYLSKEFEKYSNDTVIVTEDGSMGRRGYVTDYVDFEKYDTVVTCGPEIMMNKIVSKCREKKIKCYVSLERRMACGLGACLGCTVETINGNKRACKDGPIFSSEELI